MKPRNPFVALLLVAACTPEGQRVQEPAGDVSFVLDHAAEATAQVGNKALWQLAECTVTTQRIGRTSYNRDLGLTEIATALGRRYALEDIDGELDAGPCDANGIVAACLGGVVAVDGREIRRRGLLLADGTELVLIETLGEPEAVDRVFERVQRSVQMGGEPDA